MHAPSGSLIAYATAPAEPAADGAARKNALHTSAILEHVHTPNISILQLFQRVRTTVMTRTNNQQVPWESTSLSGDFYMR